MAPLDVMTIRLHLRGIRVLEVVEDLPERLVVAVAAISSVIRCGRCGAKTDRVHATKAVKVADLPHAGRPTTLLWRRRRFRCRSCRATTTESQPLFEGRMTTRLARVAVKDVADMTVSAVARRYGLGWHQVMALVLAHGKVLAKARRRRPCRVLLVDEKAMRKGRGNFSTILTDGDSGRVIAVIEGRSAAVLGAWLERQSPAWRRGVKVAVTDMAECYRKAIRTHLPHARHVADRFHVVRNFSKALVSARRDAQRTARGRPHVPSVFHARYLLMKRLDRLSDGDAVKLCDIFEAHPGLEVVWALVQRFHIIFVAEDEEAVNEAVEDFEAAYADAEADASVDLRRAITSFSRWGNESLAFHLSGRITNARSEGTNNKIECLERMAYGFRSRPNYEARVLLVCCGHPAPVT
ncbi:MAG: ISL3 family transposase [Acidimicrobiia bacterium]